MNWVVRVFCLSMLLLSECKDRELGLSSNAPYTYIMFGAFGMAILSSLIYMGTDDNDKRVASASVSIIFLIISLVILA